MKIAVAATGTDKNCSIDSRFGRAKNFIVYDNDSDDWETVDNIQNLNAAQGAGIQAAANVVNTGCNVLVCCHCGPKAFNVLKEASVTVFSACKGTVEDTVRLCLEGKLNKLDGADVEGHW